MGLGHLWSSSKADLLFKVTSNSKVPFNNVFKALFVLDVIFHQDNVRNMLGRRLRCSKESAHNLEELHLYFHHHLRLFAL